MQGTRRAWGAVTLVGLLSFAAVVYAEPLLVVGAGGLTGWLLGQQLRFVRTVTTLQSHLTVRQSVAHAHVRTDETTPVVFHAALPQEIASRRAVQLDIEARFPVAAHVPATADTHLTIDETTHESTTTVEVTWPVAGEFTVDHPTVTVQDHHGLFTTQFPAPIDASPTVTVRPRRPRTLHIGAGGEQVATAFGDTKTGEFGRGLDPGDIREYVPGDTLRQIDWKATARSDGPHVREFEEETDHQTVLIVDHRQSMATGPTGETKLEYARHVALAFADHAQAEQDPLGLFTVGTAGLTNRILPATTPTTVTRIQTTLHDLTPTEEAVADSHQQPAATEAATPSAASQKATVLQQEASAFSTRLHPFFAAAQPYVHRITTQPLYNTLRTQLPRIDGRGATVLVTDDHARAEVQEAVKLAQTQSNEVFVFLTPTVLYEQGGFADLDTAYTRYTEFEEFRRQLTQLDGVSAFEVAPGDRLEALLAAQSQDAEAPHQPTQP